MDNNRPVPNSVFIPKVLAKERSAESVPVRWELEHGCKATWSATGTPLILELPWGRKGCEKTLLAVGQLHWLIRASGAGTKQAKLTRSLLVVQPLNPPS